MQVIDKEWGFEQVLFNGPLCSKFLHVKAGKKCSYHAHPVKDETFYVFSGECLITQGKTSFPLPWRTLKKGDSEHVPHATWHSFASKEGCILLEVSTHHEDSDVMRLIPSGDL